MITSPLDPDEKRDLDSLVGKCIVSVEYINQDEGEYVLTFSDGSLARFSACGDDATYVTLKVNP